MGETQQPDATQAMRVAFRCVAIVLLTAVVGSLFQLARFNSERSARWKSLASFDAPITEEESIDEVPSRTFSEDSQLSGKQGNKNVSNNAIETINTVPSKKLWLIPGHGGFSNQLQCLNLAATLAIQYNRTLWVGAAYTGSKHEDKSFSLADLFDPEDRSPSSSIDPQPKLEIRSQKDQPDLASSCSENNFSINPDVVNDGTASIDPFPNRNCIALTCYYAHQMTTTPSQWFPQADRLWFPYAKPYHEMASRMWEDIEGRVAGTPIGKDNGTVLSNLKVRILGMTIRLGDAKTNPVHPYCISGDSGNSSGQLVAEGNESVVVYCQTSTADGNVVRWSWGELLKQLAEEHSLLGDFDAIYVATSDPEWIKQQWKVLHQSEKINSNATRSLPLFTLPDFPYVMESFEFSSVKALLVEELLMAKHARTYVPSFPSTITEAVLRIRLHENGFRKQDLQLRKLYERMHEMMRNKRTNRKNPYETKDGWRP